MARNFDIGFVCSVCGDFLEADTWEEARELKLEHLRGHDKPREPQGILEEETLG